MAREMTKMTHETKGLVGTQTILPLRGTVMAFTVIFVKQKCNLNSELRTSNCLV